MSHRIVYAYLPKNEEMREHSRKLKRKAKRSIFISHIISHVTQQCESCEYSANTARISIFHFPNQQSSPLSPTMMLTKETILSRFLVQPWENHVRLCQHPSYSVWAESFSLRFLHITSFSVFYLAVKQQRSFVLCAERAKVRQSPFEKRKRKKI